MHRPHTVDHLTLERQIRTLHAAWLRAAIAAAFRSMRGRAVTRAARPAVTPA
ncbi:MAG: hypothetical protein JJU42_13825 [Rhodobacteraceae bacterium]|nr:hypothetical protein [Paracoccaceae bacterium]